MDLKQIIADILPEKILTKTYLRNGCEVAYETLFPGVGLPIGFDNMVSRLVFWEDVYVMKGFKPISINDFSAYVTGKTDLEEKINVPLEHSVPVFYAKHFQEEGYSFENRQDL